MKPVRKGFHRHHVVPKHAGGTDDDDNIVYLTVDEHIQAHLDLYEKYGKEADKDAASILLAHKYRSNSEVKQLNFRRSCVRGGKAAHLVKLANGFYDRLGRLNAANLAGRVRPDIAARMKESWAENDWKWFTNGTEERRWPECPEGWQPGRMLKHTEERNARVSSKISALKWWNNGVIRVRRAECPGPEWKLGKKL